MTASTASKTNLRRLFTMAAVPVALGLTLVLGACSNTSNTTNTTPAKSTSEKHEPKAITTEQLEPYSCGTIERLHTMNGVFLASQPALQDFHDAKAGGVKTVINLRTPGEFKDFDEEKEVKAMGVGYLQIGFKSPEDLTDKHLDDVRALLNGGAERPILLHCSSGNRVGAVWLAHRVLDGKLSWDEALVEAKKVGMKTPAFETKVKDYIARNQGK